MIDLYSRTPIKTKVVVLPAIGNGLSLASGLGVRRAKTARF